ncbi:MAG: glycosyltransferase family 2 protein [Cyclobacteriaceae bacterium]
MTPLVTVVCLCYNHAPYVEEALYSVIHQTYQPLQILIVDDASTDLSREIIQKVLTDHPHIGFLPLYSNIGNCAAFNAVLSQVKGKYVVDFATDDVMHPDRIYRQVKKFETLSDDVGVLFTDAEYIDTNGKTLRSHFEYLFKKKLITRIPTGDVYRDVLSRYFIPSPTMLVRKKVFDELNGYDENLVYEDFDFWVRSARKFKYEFLNEKLTFIRKTKTSMSAGWYTQGDRQLHSTYMVCCKALALNRDEADRQALANRVRYEFRQSVLSQNDEEAELFYELLNGLGGGNWMSSGFRILSKLRLPLAPLRRLYHRIRY